MSAAIALSSPASPLARDARSAIRMVGRAIVKVLVLAGWRLRSGLQARRWLAIRRSWAIGCAATGRPISESHPAARPSVGSEPG